MKWNRPVNFRDLGGIAAADGRPVLPRRILRSGELVGLSADEGRALLEDYQLKTVIDLRSDGERAQRPNDALPVKTVHIDVLGAMSPQQNDVGKSGLESARSAAQLHRSMCELYRKIIAEEGARRRYRDFVDVFLAQGEGAVLLHCYAGKDRTGLGAAILLTLLGASQEDIIDDYMRSNLLRAAENEAVLRGLMAQRPMSDDEVAAFRVAMGVSEAFVAAALDEAQRQFGGMMGYCKTGLGVTDSEVAQLRAMYLTP